jgi:hypothetical protein
MGTFSVAVHSEIRARVSLGEIDCILKLVYALRYRCKGLKPYRVGSAGEPPHHQNIKIDMSTTTDSNLDAIAAIESEEPGE